jgi:putative transposase
VKERAELVEALPAGLSLRAQCELLGISRGANYYEPRPESAENLALLRRLDELHLERPVFGSWRLAALLRREGWEVNRKRAQRLMALMGIRAIYPQRNLSGRLGRSAVGNAGR